MLIKRQMNYFTEQFHRFFIATSRCILKLLSFAHPNLFQGGWGLFGTSPQIFMFFQVLNKRVRVWGGVGLAKLVDAAFAPFTMQPYNLGLCNKYFGNIFGNIKYLLL